MVARRTSSGAGFVHGAHPGGISGAVRGMDMYAKLPRELVMEGSLIGGIISTLMVRVTPLHSQNYLFISNRLSVVCSTKQIYLLKSNVPLAHALPPRLYFSFPSPLSPSIDFFLLLLYI